MAKTKKNAALMHPIDTVMHWYEEVQTIPAQLKKNFEVEKEKAHQDIKKLTGELKKAKALHQKAKTLKAQAVRKAKKQSSHVATTLLDQANSQFNAAASGVLKVTKEINAAKTQISHSKLKQKYLQALEKAFLTVTKLFTRKQKSSLKHKKSPKKRKKTAHHATASRRFAPSHRPAARTKKRGSSKRTSKTTAKRRTKAHA